jgi:hypothetical protein
MYAIRKSNIFDTSPIKIKIFTDSPIKRERKSMRLIRMQTSNCTINNNLYYINE